MVGHNELHISKLNSTAIEDFELWMIRFSAVIESEDLSDEVFDVGEPSTEDRAEAQLRLSRMRKKKAIIVTNLGDDPLHVFQSVNIPAQMIIRLSERYSATKTESSISVITYIINCRNDGSLRHS